MEPETEPDVQPACEPAKRGPGKRFEKGKLPEGCYRDAKGVIRKVESQDGAVLDVDTLGAMKWVLEGRRPVTALQKGMQASYEKDPGRFVERYQELERERSGVPGGTPETKDEGWARVEDLLKEAAEPDGTLPPG